MAQSEEVQLDNLNHVLKGKLIIAYNTINKTEEQITNADNYIVEIWKQLASTSSMTKRLFENLVWEYVSQTKRYYTKEWLLSVIGEYEYKKGRSKGKKTPAHFTQFGRWLKSASSYEETPILYSGYMLVTRETHDINYDTIDIWTSENMFKKKTG